MIDLHCHLLPGVDDGPADIAESLAMAALLAEHGYRSVCCTPHCICGAYDNTPPGVCAAVSELQAALDRAGIPLRLVPGMEYYLDEFFAGGAVDILPLGGSRLVLVEAPMQGTGEAVHEGINRVLRQRLIPLVAHPERCGFFLPQKPEGAWRRLQRRFAKGNDTPPPTGLEQWREMGCLFQGNLGSFGGIYGTSAARRAGELLSRGFYDCLASDGHSADHLRACLQGPPPAEARRLMESPRIDEAGGFQPLRGSDW